MAPAPSSSDPSGGSSTTTRGCSRPIGTLEIAERACSARRFVERGLLDESIVVFATEFGRAPGSQGGNGRDHHIYGFSVFFAGGSIRGSNAHGATDEIGCRAEELPHGVTDVPETVLTLLGLDPHRMELPGHKLPETDFGEPIHEILT